MTSTYRNRSRLMGGCASAAMALALMLAPERADAQGIQASGNVVFGSANITDTGPTTTTVDLTTPTVVIDWTPAENAAGDALPFIAAGSTGIFQSGVTPDFAVLNRILPSTNNNIIAIDGAVISRFQLVSGATTPAGLVAFYSPTGILIGGTATFDVGRLLLTTLDTSNASFDNFANGGNLSLVGTAGSTARIQINPGAQITASPENAFFAVVAAEIDMRGASFVNGSSAFVVGREVNLSFSNGLFNISIPVGTDSSGEVLRLDGSVGGPSSTGGMLDNHLIYAVARAQGDPISMLFSGNLGFEPAASAGIINGEIILAANYNVFGRSVAGGSVSDGIAATFNQNSATSEIQADIFIEDFTSTSSLLAIGTNRVQATAATAASEVTGNLLLVGRESAELSSLFGQDFTINGDVLVDSRDYGVVSSSLATLDVINAQGGDARIIADFAGTITVNGSALVTADAIGGADDLSGIAGTAQGGSAQIVADDTGLVTITGAATISARGLGTQVADMTQGAEARGGLANLLSARGGAVDIGQSLTMFADAIGADGFLVNSSTQSDAFGGFARIGVIDGAGSISVGGITELDANGSGGTSNNTGAGSVGDAGEATINVAGLGSITFGSTVILEATGSGGINAGGTGGVARGGRASAQVTGGGSITFSSTFSADTLGDGGDGLTGGAGFGGIAGINVVTGTANVTGSVFAGTEGVGGDASFGFGGDGGLGRGGTSFIQAEGTATDTATLTIGGDATAFAQGTGGVGGASDESAILAGRGGDGYGGQFSVPNQADPAFNGGAFILAGSDNGTITVGGVAVTVAQGYGGSGGNGGMGLGAFVGGRGGDGFGGLAQMGLTLLGGTGAIGGGAAIFADVFAQADGFGGSGGFSGSDFATGDGGNATGGFAALTVRAGTLTAGLIELTANAFGGQGTIGGAAQGGTAAIFGGLGGTLTANNAIIDAEGIGGFSGVGVGGAGVGGIAAIQGDGITVTLNGSVQVDASGRGGNADDGAGGDGTGGEAYIAFVTPSAPGAITITNHAQVAADGIGGGTQTNFAAGNGNGGLAYIEAQGGGDIALGSAQVTAIGLGGFALSDEGGDGLGGIVRIGASGIGSTLSIARNVPSIFSETLGGASIFDASGFGEAAAGGPGFGGTGTGGTLSIIASQGGTITLPTGVALDPDSAAPALIIAAEGIGGNTVVDGGVGGEATGGDVLIEVDGTDSAIVMGETVLSVLAQGGSSALSVSNVAGGNAFGGNRGIRVVNGGELTLELVGGISGGQGGNASGSGRGGDGNGGSNIVELNAGTLNVLGELSLIDETTGGFGAIGGNGFGDGGGGSLSLTAVNSTINLSPNVNGTAGIVIGGTTRGGDGDSFGGAARTSEVLVGLTNTQVNGGTIRIAPVALGGAALNPAGTGGDASNAAITVNLTGSILNLEGENVISVTALGGTGGIDGVGGTGLSGTVDMTLLDTAMTIVADGSGVSGILRVTSRAEGGSGGTYGDAASARAQLALGNSTLQADIVEVRSLADATGATGQIGGIATAGEALFTLGGASLAVADLVEIVANALTSAGGESRGGSASLVTAAGSTAEVNASLLRLSANGLGADAADLANFAGRFAVEVGGGNVNIQTLEASALGDALSGAAPPSRLEANGGDIIVSAALTADALGDVSVFTSGGGIIGTPATAGTTAITINTRGNIIVEDDDSGLAGLSGQSITLAAGGSILLGGDMAVDDGPVSIIANNGTALPVLSGPPITATITMTAGTSIAAGSGTVEVRMLDGGGVPGRQSGAITLANITAGNIDVANLGTGAGTDIVVLGSGVLSASGSGRAIVLASADGEVINLNGDAGLNLTGTGTYAIFAATPTGSQVGTFANYARRYSVADLAAFDALNPGGNFAAFRITPVLTVTADDVSRFYGDANVLTASYAGFQPGDSIADLLGAPELATLADATSNVGLFTITAALGTLLSEQGYQFIFNPGQLTVAPRPITITADDLAKLPGQPDPALTFTIGGRGLVNGDTIFGALVRDPGETLGAFAIRQGTLTAGSNYLTTFVPGELIIGPPPTPGEVTSPTSLEPSVNPQDTLPPTDDEEEEQFGMDFPEKPDAQLINEDALLDEPVTSGGDASLYGGGDVPPAGGQ